VHYSYNSHTPSHTPSAHTVNALNLAKQMNDAELSAELDEQDKALKEQPATPAQISTYGYARCYNCQHRHPNTPYYFGVLDKNRGPYYKLCRSHCTDTAGAPSKCFSRYADFSHYVAHSWPWSIEIIETEQEDG